MKKPPTHFIFTKGNRAAVHLIYPVEHNGTILLTSEDRTKQLSTPPPYITDQTTTVTLGAPRVNKRYIVVQWYSTRQSISLGSFNNTVQ